MSGYEKETRDVKIIHEWESTEANPDQKINETTSSEPMNEWSNNRPGNRTDKLGLGNSDVLDKSMEINYPTGLSIISNPISIPEIDRSKPLDINLSDADEVVLPESGVGEVSNLEKLPPESELYAKFATFGYTRDDKPDSVWLGFKEYLIGATIDPMSVRALSTNIEGDAVNRVLKSNGKLKLVIRSVDKAEERNDQVKDGVTIDYATYLITLGVISRE